LGGVVEDADLVGIPGGVLDDVDQRLRRQRSTLDQLVEVGDIGGVMLAVVEAQGIGRNVGLESRRFIGKRGKFKSHGGLLVG
jgi:hypothetical protein